jgi:hypothetical protein
MMLVFMLMLRFMFMTMGVNMVMIMFLSMIMVVMMLIFGTAAGLSRRGKESPARACYRFINRVNTTLSGGHLLPVSKGRECR